MSKRGSETGLQGGLALVFSLRPLHARLLLLAVALVVSLVFTLVLRGPLHVFEEQVGALGWTIAPDAEPEQRVSVIAIEEKSVEQLGSWPWPRETMGRLSAALNDYGGQLQLYDIVFPEARAGDAELIAALSAGNAVLPQAPVLGSDQVVRTGALSHSLTGVGCSAQDARSSSFIANNQAFASIPKGHIALNVDGDGAVRQVPAYVCVDGAAYPALALSAFIN